MSIDLQDPYEVWAELEEFMQGRSLSDEGSRNLSCSMDVSGVDQGQEGTRDLWDRVEGGEVTEKEDTPATDKERCLNSEGCEGVTAD